MSVFVASCIPEEKVVVQGMAPIYGDPDDFSKISFKPAQTSVNRGNILIYKNYILINERLKGIHVYDNADPTNPINIGFINIPGNSILTIDKDILYADNTIHLIVIDISDIQNPKYLTHISNHFKNSLIEELFPPNYSGDFECAKGGKGIVLGWEEKSLENPKCFTNN